MANFYEWRRFISPDKRMQRNSRSTMENEISFRLDAAYYCSQLTFKSPFTILDENSILPASASASEGGRQSPHKVIWRVSVNQPSHRPLLFVMKFKGRFWQIQVMCDSWADIQRTAAVDSLLGSTTNGIRNNHFFLVPRVAQGTWEAKKREITEAAELKFRGRYTSWGVETSRMWRRESRNSGYSWLN